MGHPAEKQLDELEERLLRGYSSAMAFANRYAHDTDRVQTYLGIAEQFDAELSALRKLRFDFDKLVDVIVDDATKTDEEEGEYDRLIATFEQAVEAEVARRLST